MPRASREQAERNRAAVVRAASVLLREGGPAAVTVEAVSGRAGLTHGGFYKRFASKEALLDEALGAAGRERREAVEGVLADGGRERLLDVYLGAAHRDVPGAGCAVAALAGDVAADPGGPLSDGFRRALDDLVAALAVDGDRAGALADAALLVGAVALARAVRGTADSDAVLAAARERLRPGEG